MNLRISYLPIFVCTAFVLGLAHSSGGASTPQSVFVPPDAGMNPDGNAFFTPFDGPGRFQQVYDASAFGVLSESGGGWIRQIIFRVDASIGHPFISTVGEIQLNLSTTLQSPDDLSPLFENNIGTDDTRVIGPSSLYLSGGGGGGLSVFTVLFDLPGQPFFYDPAKGNLLLDFRIYEGFEVDVDPGVPPQQGVGILDAFDTVGDSISSVYAPGNPNLSSGGQVSSLGLATLLVITPIPEPSTWAILVIACVVALVGWRRTRARKEERHGTH